MVLSGLLVVELLGGGDEFLDVGQPLGVVLVVRFAEHLLVARSSPGRARITSCGGRSSCVRSSVIMRWKSRRPVAALPLMSVICPTWPAASSRPISSSAGERLELVERDLADAAARLVDDAQEADESSAG